MRKYFTVVIAVSAVVAALLYYAVRELGNVLEEESLDLFTEEPDFE